MNVLLTGASGRVGTAIADHLGDADRYAFTYVDVEPNPDHDTVVVDVTDRAALRPQVEGQDAVVHLAWPPALTPWTDELGWNTALAGHLEGICTTLDLAAQANVGTYVFASSNHAVGMYEREHAPDLYEPDYPLTLDHRSPVRPDSLYGVAKLFGENVLRLATDVHDLDGFALRLGAVREPEYDHPYGGAEEAVADGEIERESTAYYRKVQRMKAMWQSRRDLAHLVDCCLQANGLGFEVLYGVSDNAGRWFDIERARQAVGYDPADDGGAWTGPPDEARG